MSDSLKNDPYNFPSVGELFRWQYLAGAVTRMSYLGLAMKAFAVYLFVGLSEYQVGSSGWVFVLSFCLCVTIFWVLDGFFLKSKWILKDMLVAKTGEVSIPVRASKTWLGAIFAKTMLILYPSLMLIFALKTLLLSYY